MKNAFVHTELTTENTKEAVSFYKKVFSWKLTDLGPSMGGYTMIDYGDKNTGGGIQPKTMPEQPTAWMPSVEVESVKATMHKAEKAGATLVVPYQEIGGMGAIGVFVDPTGASLGVWERAKQAPQKKASSSKKAAKKKASSKPSSKKATKKASKKK